eukprot:m.492877 g.492877  ORF g.492877 m.492877 type:complete len:645 (-) comp34501_c0_seq1:50-1984(-)
MKAQTPQIRWHWSNDIKAPTPIYSVDFHHRGGDTWRLASAGADGIVRLWKVDRANGKTDVTHLADLARHESSVNAIRFSPDGKLLATAGDDLTIFLWAATSAPTSSLLNTEEFNKEHWRPQAALRGHASDIMDLAWSPDSKFLLSGSVDHSAIVFDVATGKQVQQLKDHRNFVQGVAWSPLGDQVITQSSDRSARVYNCASGKKRKFTCVAANVKLPQPKDDAAGGTKLPSERLFVDETKTTFFRRASYSPDGSLVMTPAGRHRQEDGTDVDTLYIFRKSMPATPVLRLRAADSSVVAVRCCPVLFKRQTDDSESTVPMFKGLQHRIVFAVATLHAVMLYCTEQLAPFAILANLHLAPLSDLTWSKDGLVLAIASEDGYCSLVTFEENELGVVSENVAPLMQDQVAGVSGSEGEQSHGIKDDQAGAGAAQQSLLQQQTAATAAQPSAATPTQQPSALASDQQPCSGSKRDQPSDCPATSTTQETKKKRRVALTTVRPLTTTPEQATAIATAATATASPTATTSKKPRRIVPTVVTHTPASTAPEPVLAATSTATEPAAAADVKPTSPTVAVPASPAKEAEAAQHNLVVPMDAGSDTQQAVSRSATTDTQPQPKQVKRIKPTLVCPVVAAVPVDTPSAAKHDDEL